jgi:DNA phosphorothioation-dependent restriction protein DptG
MSKRQGTKCKYLVDASALYPLLLSGKAFNLEQFAVSSLTEYELGNALWKEAKKKRIKFKDAAQTFSETLSELKKISIDGINNTLALAIERNLTFYDASYAHVAEKEGLLLVTEDTELLKKCKCAIKTKDIEDT